MHFYVTAKFIDFFVKICSQGLHRIILHQKNLRLAETAVPYCITNGQITVTLYKIHLYCHRWTKQKNRKSDSHCNVKHAC